MAPDPSAVHRDRAAQTTLLGRRVASFTLCSWQDAYPTVAVAATPADTAVVPGGTHSPVGSKKLVSTHPRGNGILSPGDPQGSPLCLHPSGPDPSPFPAHLWSCRRRRSPSHGPG